MITSEQLLNYQFTKVGRNGYKDMEVDELISSVAETVSFYEKKVRDMQRIIEDLKKEETIIQATLVNAQKLASQVTEEAQAKADEVVAQAQQKADALLSEREAEVAKATEDAEKAVAQMLDAAKAKAADLLENAKRTTEEMARATGESQAQQEILLASMKNEVAAFRAKLIEQYKEHIRLIEQLPNETVELARAVAATEQEETSDSGSNLVKIYDEMKANENAAADAVDEVAVLTETQAPIEDAQVEIAEEIQPELQRIGGFSVIIDDDED